MSNLYPLATIILTKYLDLLPEAVKSVIEVETLKIGVDRCIVKINNIDNDSLREALVEALGNDFSATLDLGDELTGYVFRHNSVLPDELFLSVDNEIEYEFILKEEKSEKTIYEKIVNSFFRTNFMIHYDKDVALTKNLDGFSFGTIGDVESCIINMRISFFADSIDFEEVYEEKGEVEIVINSIKIHFKKTDEDKALITIQY